MGRLRDILRKYITEKNMFDIVEYFKKYGIDYLYPVKNYSFILNIKSRNSHDGEYRKGGGKSDGENEYLLDLKINKVKYQVNIDEYYDMIYTQMNTEKSFSNKNVYNKINTTNIIGTENKNRKIISFIKFNAIKDERCDYKEIDHCGVLIIDYKKKSSIIQSINNYTDCVKCLNTENIFFKTGDILTQIMIIMSKKNNLKKIYLIDNTYLQCKNSKIALIHLRTMTHGKPFYTKYNFIPIDEKDILNKNLKNYKKNKTLTKEELIKYFNYRKFNLNDEKDKKMLNYINNILIPRFKSKNTIKFVISTIINDKSNVSCSLLYNIYMKIYEDVGYLKYENKHFVLDLKNVLI